MGLLDAPAPSVARMNAAESLLRRGGGAPPIGGQTVVLFGDSIVSQNAQQYNTVGGIGGVRAYNNQGWFSHAQVLLGHRLKLLKNSGISGENTTQWLARIATDVINLHPDMVVIGGPTNDATSIANGARTLATVKANLTSIWDQIAADTAVIIQALITPWDETNIVSSDYAARRKATFDINQYIREQGRLRGFTVVDFYTPLSSGVKSDWKTGSYNPGDTSKLHPNGQGAYDMAAEFAATVAPITNPVDILPMSNAETANLVNTVHANGSALAIGTGGTVGAGGTGTLATGRRCDPLATSVFTCSQVSRTDGVPGVWDQVKLTSGWVKYGVNVTGFGTTYTTDDEVYAMAEFETDGDLSSGSGASNYCLLNLIAMKPDFGVGRQGYDLAVSTADTFQGGTHFARKGVMMTPLVVVPSTATLRLALQFELRGSGTLRIGRIGIYKVGTGPGADVWSRADANAS